MEDKIKRDRQLLVLFFFLWMASTIWAWASQYKRLDLSNLSQEQLILISTVTIVIILVPLIISSIYLYKMYKWHNLRNTPALLMTVLYIIFGFIYPIVAVFIFLHAIRIPKPTKSPIYKQKKFSEMSPSELKKTRIISATVYAILMCIFVSYKSSTHLVEYIIFGILGWTLWFFLFHRVVIWSEKKFTKR